jgi:CRISPR-associated protein Csd1
MAAKLWRCAVLNEAIPEPFAAQALGRAAIDFIQGDTPKHARIGLLRAYLCRKGDHDVKPHLNEAHPDPAYHCGRLLAVLDDIQYAALGNVGAGIVQRYYAAASATPALTLGRLVRLANTGHLPKIKPPQLAQWHENRLARVWGQLRQDPPPVLSLEGQTLFAMGYYQQKAEPKPQTNEKE